MSRSPEQDSDWMTGVGDSAAGESARVARLVRVAQHIEMHKRLGSIPDVARGVDWPWCIVTCPVTLSPTTRANAFHEATLPISGMAMA